MRRQLKKKTFEVLEDRRMLAEVFNTGMRFTYATVQPLTGVEWAVVREHEPTSLDIDVSLTRQPNVNITFTVTSSDTTEGNVNTALTFRPDNYLTPQTVTLQGVDDNDDDGVVAFDVKFGTISAPGDSYFDGKIPSVIRVKNLDDDCKANNDTGLIVTEDTVTNLAVMANDTDAWATPGTTNVFSSTVISGGGQAAPHGAAVQYTPAENGSSGESVGEFDGVWSRHGWIFGGMARAFKGCQERKLPWRFWRQSSGTSLTRPSAWLSLVELRPRRARLCFTRQGPI